MSTFQRLFPIRMSISYLLVICAMGTPICMADSRVETLDLISRTSEPQPPNKKALVFVHGTLGDPKGTWTGKSEIYWPVLVNQDPALEDFDVFVFGFYSPAVGEAPTIVDIANQLKDLLRIKNILSSTPNGPYEKLYFVAHSLGNLIVRQALQQKEDYERVMPS